MADNANNSEKTSSSSRGKRKYLSQSEVPAHSLAEALRIPRALADEYGKQPASPIEIGAAIGVQPTTGKFRSLAGASLAYGLTDGGPRVAEIGLTDVGLRVVAPTEEGDDVAAMREAFLRPRVIREFLERYNGSKLPTRRIGLNVLETMGVPTKAVDRTFDLIVEGARSLGLTREIGDSTFVHLKGIDLDAVDKEQFASNGAVDEAEEPQGEDTDVLYDDPPLALPGEDSAPPLDPSSTREQKPTRPNAIFVGHGKNKKPRDQLVRLLEQYKIPYKVAEEEANKGRPIPVKVKETMQACGAAILIFSADEEFNDANDESIWRPSENVVHELGAASMLYDDRIIIFREDSVELATNYESIGYITFEKDDLNAKFNELLRELIALGILRVSVND